MAGKQSGRDMSKKTDWKRLDAGSKMAFAVFVGGSLVKQFGGGDNLEENWMVSRKRRGKRKPSGL